jgi:NAD(P)-dependent dehydrogenase (short-subunit alcohol dehydrogenase family)
VRVRDKVVVVTGGAKGIGQALCERFHKEGARKVIVADIDEAGAKTVAAAIGGEAFRCDVTKEADIVHLVTDVENRIGPIELFCSNAGVATGMNPLTENAAGDSNDLWTFGWQVHVMAHVYAARILVPRMKARGGGYFLQTISAAGLLSQVGSAVYSTTKHAAVVLPRISPSRIASTTSASRCFARKASTRRCCAACPWARSRATASCRRKRSLTP